MASPTWQMAEAAHPPLLSMPALRAHFAEDYAAYRGGEADRALLELLRRWAARGWQIESASEGAFIDLLFKRTWGYRASGEGAAGAGYTLHPQYPVARAGVGGHTGRADLALGWFGRGDRAPVPQVLCELKDTRSGLDAPQRGGRSPVEQCFDYLREARSGRISTVLPAWALVSDMNELRLYLHGDRSRCQRFVLRPAPGDPATPLTEDSEAASFQRFLLATLFRPERLLSTAGPSPLERLVRGQLRVERDLEAQFYSEYQAYREHLFRSLSEANPAYAEAGQLRRLLALTQRLLDRFLFLLYCEDMGRSLSFPPHLLRELLREASTSRFYHPEGAAAWDALRRLFAAMRDGGPFGEAQIHRFNGGLFAEDPALDALRVPDHVLCAKAQGESPEALLSAPLTLLFFSAKYNFGLSADGGERALTLNAMGRIFEQSLTDLEVMEAEAEGRTSLVKVTKRKRDGVYYTPEPITAYLVAEAIGGRLGALRAELGLAELSPPEPAEIQAHRADARRAPQVRRYRSALRAYSERLNTLRVLDPSCGSGAFLLQAFRFLYEERRRVAAELERVDLEGNLSLFDMHQTMRAVLSDNLYGVDINPESVEITQLALWLHTALPERPLASLEAHIRCGNSLLDPPLVAQLPEPAREAARAFDWEAAFPEVFEGDDPGFDVILGNPPYVKLQHLRRAHPALAEALSAARRPDGAPRYESTQTGNFDLYLPFIERGLELLKRDGRLGYIAPSLWLSSEYGRGLRALVRRTRSLARWVDFGSHQVFPEAMTYTALQLFVGSPSPAPQLLRAPKGADDLSALSWSRDAAAVPWEALPEGGPWRLLPPSELALWDALRQRCRPLGERARIAVGVQTSADDIYHLTRAGEGLYRPKRSDDLVSLEPGALRPLISGPETDRYVAPSSEKVILFPYAVEGSAASLIPAEEMAARFPKAWAYLKRHEAALRARERGKMDRDDAWWGYNYPKNLALQHLPKLAVAQTVPCVRVAYDVTGAHCLNNVRVNGIFCEDAAEAWYLLGVLNAPVADYVFRRTAKPKAGGYFEANKQYIAPLPIPDADADARSEVGSLAEALQQLVTRRAQRVAQLQRRLDSPQCEDDHRPPNWLWAEVRAASALKSEAPAALTGRARSRWAKAERARRLQRRLDGLDLMLQPGVALRVGLQDSALSLSIGGVPAIQGVFLSEEAAPFVAAQWRQATRDLSVTEAFDGARLLRLLTRLRRTDNPAIPQQVAALDAEIATLDAGIEAGEAALNARVYALYGLGEAERRVVEGG